MTHHSRNKNKLSGDWTGALCVHGLHLHPLGSVCACVSAASSSYTLYCPWGNPGYFLSQGRQQEEQTYLPPPVGLPTGASPRTTGLLCPRPRQMTAVLLFYFGLVLINTGYLPLLGPPTTTHRTLKREGERSGDGCWVETERKVGHVSQLKIIALNVYTWSRLRNIAY